MADKPFGPIAVLGSGETSLSGGRVFESIAQRLSQPLRIAILETPAGFELNSAQVSGRVAEYLSVRLKNYNPEVSVIPARKRGTAFSPDDPAILSSLLRANLIFMGPGSPTYAVRQLRKSLAWNLILARHRMGAALIFSSAAVIAAGAWVLPVYEIFKVGEDVRAVPGLDLLGGFGLSISIIPHWNNADGGADLDTSRCFVGMERFAKWCAQLPGNHTTLGLDEHTGLIIDLAAEECRVNGVSSVTLLRECNPEIYPAGATFPLGELGPIQWPVPIEKGIPVRVWKMTRATQDSYNAAPEPPAKVLALVARRNKARLDKDWEAADILRDKIAAHGWQVRDTPEGQKLSRYESPDSSR